eukprot:5956938-Prymnesium_polylepis.1
MSAAPRKAKRGEPRDRGDGHDRPDIEPKESHGRIRRRAAHPVAVRDMVDRTMWKADQDDHCTGQCILDVGWETVEH